MKIQVTQEDIDNGLPRRIDFCPVALAVRRAFPKNEQVYVGGDRILIGGRRYHSPSVVFDFISLFDSQAGGLPFEFETYQV